MSLNDRIKEARKRKGITQEQLGALIGVAKTTVAGYENNREPTAAKVGEIADALGVDVNFLFQDEMKVMHDNHPTPHEFEIIEKYRKLDNFGKESVDIVIERELNRIEIYGKLGERKIITLAEYEPTKPPTYLIPYWEEGASAGNGIYQLNDTESIMMTLWASELTKQADFIIKVSGDSMEPDFYDGDKVLVDRKVRVEKGDVGIFWKDGNTYIKEMGENELISKNSKRANIPTDDFNRVICMGKVIGKLTDEMIAIG